MQTLPSNVAAVLTKIYKFTINLFWCNKLELEKLETYVDFHTETCFITSKKFENVSGFQFTDQYMKSYGQIIWDVGLDRYSSSTPKGIIKNIFIDWTVNVLVIVNVKVISFIFLPTQQDHETHISLRPSLFLPCYGVIHFFFFIRLYLTVLVDTIFKSYTF
jgi:hypothetical protein